MDNVTINGKNYYSEDKLREMALYMAISELEKAMMRLRVDNSPVAAKVPVAEVYPGEKEGITPAASILAEKEQGGLLAEVVEQLRREDASTAALIHACHIITVCKRHNIVYFHVPSFMSPMFFRDSEQAVARRGVVTKVCRKVLDQDVTAMFVHSKLRGFSGETRKVCDHIATALESNEDLLEMTAEKRTTYIAWCLAEAEIASNQRFSYQYGELADACGLGHSLVYHAMQKLRECGLVNFDKLVGRGIKNNAA